MAESSARPIDRVVGGYLVLSSIALTFPHHQDGWLLLLLLHLAAGAVLLAGGLEPARRFADNGSARSPSSQAASVGARWAEGIEADALGAEWGRRVAAFLVDWYPLILVPVLYLELQLLNQAVWGGQYFDGVILRWERAIFGGQPSIYLAERWDSLWVSELLHLAYLSYFLLLYVFPAVLYAKGRRLAFRMTVFAMMLGFGIHYLVFIFFPVQGPRYLFPGPSGSQTNGVLYHFARDVLEAGSSRGAAFPSSHVGLAAVQTGNAFRFAPRVAPLFALATVGIALGAVYGGFHYGVDVTVGLVVGAAAVLVAPAVWRRLQ